MVAFLDGIAPEQLMEVAQDMLSNKRRSERVIYYRKPTTKLDGTPAGEPNWITWNDSQEQKQVQLWALGWVPLTRFGTIEAKSGDNAPDGPFEKYGPWGPILCHPEGPAEFPVDQIMTYRWYDPDRCPVPGVRFPQLAAYVATGGEIVEYDCPECNAARYAKPIYLARHLRVSHNYDRSEIIALGKELGLDFSKELVTRGRIKREYTLDDIETEPEPEAVAPIAVTRVQVTSQKKERTAEEQAKIDERMAKARAARQAKTEAE